MLLTNWPTGWPRVNDQAVGSTPASRSLRSDLMVRVNLGWKRHSKDASALKARLKRASTMAHTKFALGGNKKKGALAPKPVSLPKFTFDDPDER